MQIQAIATVALVQPSVEAEGNAHCVDRDLMRALLSLLKTNASITLIEFGPTTSLVSARNF
jgi:hypothetical protein